MQEVRVTAHPDDIDHGAPRLAHSKKATQDEPARGIASALALTILAWFALIAFCCMVIR